VNLLSIFKELSLTRVILLLLIIAIIVSSSWLAACCTAFRWKMCKGSMFDTVEQPSRSSSVFNINDDEARRIDIFDTFSPQPHVLHIGCKIGLTGWIASVMARSIMGVQYPSFWLAYLTHWSLVIAAAYILMSTLSAVYLATQTHSKCAEFMGGTGVLINITWACLPPPLPWRLLLPSFIGY